LRAFELGAVECFPKPLKATPEQFAKTVAKLGKIVLAAANSNVKDRKPAVVREAKARPAFTWNGHYLAISTSMGGIDALTQILADFPADGPPTVIVLQSEPAVVDTFINRIASETDCKIIPAKDGASLTPGTIHVAADPEKHIVFESRAARRVCAW